MTRLVAVVALALLGCTKKESEMRERNGPAAISPIPKIGVLTGSPSLMFLDGDLLGHRVERRWSNGPGKDMGEQYELRFWRPSMGTRETWPTQWSRVHATFYRGPGVAAVLYDAAPPHSAYSIRLYRDGTWTPPNRAVSAGSPSWSEEHWLFVDQGPRDAALIVTDREVQRIPLDVFVGDRVVVTDELTQYDLRPARQIVSLQDGRFIVYGGGLDVVARGEGKTVKLHFDDIVETIAQAEEPHHYWVGHESGRIALYELGVTAPKRVIETGGKYPALISTFVVQGDDVAAVIGEGRTSYAVVYGGDGRERGRFVAPWSNKSNRDRDYDATVALSLDGGQLAMAHPEYGELVVWDIASGKVLLSAAPDGTVLTH